MFPEGEKFLWEGMVFLAFALVCGALVERRFSRLVSAAVAGGALMGICLLQGALLAHGLDRTLVLTLLPLTAYVPAVLVLHALSRSGALATAAVWLVGFVVYFALNIFCKILLRQLARFPQLALNGVITACLAVAAGGLVFLALRFLRKPFRAYVLGNRNGWLLLCFPVCMLLALFSYFSNATTNVTVLTPLFVTALSVFLVIVRVLSANASLEKMRAMEKAVAAQMQAQRREYEDVCHRMELGRAYRHDIRHHLLVLEGMAQRENASGVAEYLEHLHGRLTGIEPAAYCENFPINAALASCIGRAREAHCDVMEHIRLTQQENPSLLLKSKVGLRKLYIRQIVTIESFNHSRVCTLVDGSMLETTDTLSSLYERLKKYPCFFLPHRAYVVNLSYVNGITATDLLMADGRSIPISRNVYPQLKEAYIRYTF